MLLLVCHQAPSQAKRGELRICYRPFVAQVRVNLTFFFFFFFFFPFLFLPFLSYWYGLNSPESSESEVKSPDRP